MAVVPPFSFTKNDRTTFGQRGYKYVFGVTGVESCEKHLRCGLALVEIAWVKAPDAFGLSLDGNNPTECEYLKGVSLCSGSNLNRKFVY